MFGIAPIVFFDPDIVSFFYLQYFRGQAGPAILLFHQYFPLQKKFIATIE